MIPARLALFIVALFSTQEKRHSLLMSYAEYAGTKHPVPYVLQLGAGDDTLYYFGSEHVYDPSHPQVGAIIAQWNAFRPTIAFNEGGDPPPENTIADAVRAHGEAGLVRYLGHRDSIPVRNLEPSLPDEVRSLTPQFSCEAIKSFYVLRQVGPFKTAAQEGSLESNVQRMLTWLSTLPELNCSPMTVEELEQAYRRLILRSDWRQVDPAWFDPVYDRPPTILNEISRTSSRFRDEHMVRLLTDAVTNHQRVYAVVGASHVVMQERALRADLSRRAFPPPSKRQ